MEVNEQQAGTGDQGTLGAGDSQTATANISILANSNEASGEQTQNAETVNSQDSEPAWKGDSRYFQTGDKAGTLKPRFRQIGGAGGPPRELSGAAPASSANEPQKFSGLDVGALRNTAARKEAAKAAVTAEDKKQLKAEKRKLSADFTARVVMRVLDAAVNIISKGQYGADFNPEQLKKRMTYRETLQDEWREYLLTLDVDLAPWAMVAVGSMEYVGEAFNTPAGKERVTTLREKVLGGIFRATIGRIFK